MQREERMSTKRVLFVALVASLIVLVAGVGPQVADTAQALPPAPQPHAPGVTIPYPGRLAGEAGQPVAQGAYAFTFALYKTQTGGDPLWSEVQEGVMVQDGAFALSLGSVNPIPRQVVDVDELWLAVSVRGPADVGFVALTPRQRVSAASSISPASPTSGGACPHDHFGETWAGDSTAAGLHVENTADALVGWSSGAHTSGVVGTNSGGGTGVFATSDSGYGLYAASSHSDGVFAYSAEQGQSGVVGLNFGDGPGVSGVSTDQTFVAPTEKYGVYGVGDATGVWGKSFTGEGVVGSSTSGSGVEGFSTTGIGVLGHSNSSHGVWGEASAVGESGTVGWHSGNGYGLQGHSESGVAIAATGTGIVHSTADSVLYLSPHDMVVREENQSVVSLAPLDNGGVRIRNQAGSGTVTRYLSIPVSTFGSLFGSPLYVKSIEVCYKTSIAQAFIAGTGVYKNPGAGGGWTAYLENATPQSSTTYTCYPVTAATPRKAVDNSTWVQFNISFNGTGAGWEVFIYTVKLTLTELQN
jgi:hypothetical protein